MISLIENNFKIVKGVINVRHKLSYKVVDNILIKYILNDWYYNERIDKKYRYIK